MRFCLRQVASSQIDVCQPQGKPAEAEPLFKRSLDINEKVLGPDHPSTITSRAWLGQLLKDQAKYSEAQPILRAVVEARERVQGSDHPDTAAALNNEAQLLKAMVGVVEDFVLLRILCSYWAPQRGGASERNGRFFGLLRICAVLRGYERVQNS